MANLRSWKKALRNAVDYPWDSDIDSDHPKCPRCGSTMDFHGHDDDGDYAYGEGYWECDSCGFKVTENDVYRGEKHEQNVGTICRTEGWDGCAMGL